MQCRKHAGILFLTIVVPSRDFGRFLCRTNSGFGRGGPGICPGLRCMIAAMRSLNSSTVSTRERDGLKACSAKHKR